MSRGRGRVKGRHEKGQTARLERPGVFVICESCRVRRPSGEFSPARGPMGNPIFGWCGWCRRRHVERRAAQ